jgi:hypothetical protein
MERADRLAREFAKRPGVCLVEVARFMGADVPGSALRVPCAGCLEWAHLKSRGPAYYSIRHDPENSVCLCSAHHRLFHAEPDAFVRFIEAVHPGRWDRLGEKLRARAESPVKRPLVEIYADWVEWYDRRNGSVPMNRAALEAKRLRGELSAGDYGRLSSLLGKMPREAARRSYVIPSPPISVTVLGDGWELELSATDRGCSVAETAPGAPKPSEFPSWDLAAEEFLRVLSERFTA